MGGQETNWAAAWFIKEVGPFLSFNGNYFNATIDLGTLSTGSYVVKVKLDNTLRKAIPGIQTLTQGATTTLPIVTLVSGDINNDNVLDIQDYNIFLSCYGQNVCTQKKLADFNDDGPVDGIDYNIFLISFIVPGD